MLHAPPSRQGQCGRLPDSEVCLLREGVYPLRQPLVCRLDGPPLRMSWMCCTMRLMATAGERAAGEGGQNRGEGHVQGLSPWMGIQDPGKGHSRTTLNPQTDWTKEKPTASAPQGAFPQRCRAERSCISISNKPDISTMWSPLTLLRMEKMPRTQAARQNRTKPKWGSGHPTSSPDT